MTDGPEDVDGLRLRLEALLHLSIAERAAIRRQLRENVIAAHSLPRLIERLLAVLQDGELPPD